MSHSVHQQLAKLADHQRTKVQENLADLASERLALQKKRTAVELNISKLIGQRETLQMEGAKASMLVMVDDALREQQACLQAIHEELEQLHDDEASVLKQWMGLHHKHDAHEKMVKKETQQEQKQLDRYFQQQMDDLFATRHVNGSGDT